MFDHLIGNHHIKKYLLKTIADNTIGNSLLFAGPDGVGKKQFALALAQVLIDPNDKRILRGSHPDVHIYNPEGKIGMHTVDSMRDFCKDIHLSPLEAQRKIFIIDYAERMLPYSSNALLKTFEEPSLDSIIILISSHTSSILPTILSRCRTITFHPIPTEEITAHLQQTIEATKAKEIALQSRGSIAEALRLAVSEGDPIKETLIKVLSTPKWSSYQDLMIAAKVLSEQVEGRQQNEEAKWREQQTIDESDLTASQKQHYIKELEGTISMSLQNTAGELFLQILNWYRDLELIHLNGNSEYLIHSQSFSLLKEQCKRGELMPLNQVQKIIQDAILSLQRSTPLKSCLEWTFLKLNRL